MCSPSAGPGARVGSPGVRLSLIGTPSSRTGAALPAVRARRPSPALRPARSRAPRRGRARAPGSSRARRRTRATAPGCARRRSRSRRDARPSRADRTACSIRSSRSDAAAERRPELRLERAQRDVAVGAAVRAVAGERAGELELAAARPAGPSQAPPRPPSPATTARRRTSSVDHLALARALALAQRDQDPDRRHQRAAADVRDLAGGLHRRPVGVAGQARAGRSARGSSCRGPSGRGWGRPGRSR